MLDCIALIKDRGGMVDLPISDRTPRRGAVAAHVREQAAEQADIDRSPNRESLTDRLVRDSYELARRHGKPEGAGSDAHVRTEVGGAYVTIDRLPTREDDLVDLVAAGAVRQGCVLHEYILNRALQPWGGIYVLPPQGRVEAAGGGDPMEWPVEPVRADFWEARRGQVDLALLRHHCRIEPGAVGKCGVRDTGEGVRTPRN